MITGTHSGTSSAPGFREYKAHLRADRSLQWQVLS
jgi:hypothetical protein